MRYQHSAYISGNGYSLGKQIVSSTALEGEMGKPDGYIFRRSGIFNRRYVFPEESNLTLAQEAAESALSDAGLNRSDLDMIIVNTLSPDYHDPSHSCLLMAKLGIVGIPSFDIRAQCSGSLYAMDIARQYISSGQAKNIMIVCSEVLSKRIDFSGATNNISMLLGDGAGAFILSSIEEKQKSTPRGIIDLKIRADGNHFDSLVSQAPGTKGDSFLSIEDIENGRHHFKMDGQKVFKHAVECMADVTTEILAANNLTVEDVDYLIPHQPNLRLLEAVFNKLKFDISKAYVTVKELGNMASASLPVAHALFVEQYGERKGALKLFLTYGSGATWGACLYRD